MGTLWQCTGLLAMPQWLGLPTNSIGAGKLCAVQNAIYCHSVLTVEHLTLDPNSPDITSFEVWMKASPPGNQKLVLAWVWSSNLEGSMEIGESAHRHLQDFWFWLKIQEFTRISSSNCKQRMEHTSIDATSWKCLNVSGFKLSNSSSSLNLLIFNFEYWSVNANLSTDILHVQTMQLSVILFLTSWQQSPPS